MKFPLWHKHKLPGPAMAMLFVSCLTAGCTLVGWESSLADQLNYDQGITMHPELDLGWLQERAAENDPYAQTRLASLYYLGVGVTQDKSAARQLFEKAAQAGVTKAQYCIGCMYLDGDAGKQDKERGFYWLKMAGSGEDSYAGYAREKLKSAPRPADGAAAGGSAGIVKR